MAANAAQVSRNNQQLTRIKPMAEKIGAMRDRLKHAFLANAGEYQTCYSTPGNMYLILDRRDGLGGIDLKLDSTSLKVTWFLRAPYKVTEDYYFNITVSQYLKLRNYIKDHKK